MNELIKTELKTPIEVALAIDENGMTTASAVYNFLELDPAHFARWCKTNILENDYAEENVDFEAFTINGEWGGQKKTDYYLTAKFAKKLCMASHSERGEEARRYFLRCEELIKIGVNKRAQEIEKKLQSFETRQAALEDKQDDMRARMDMMEIGRTTYKPSQWVKDITEDLKLLFPVMPEGKKNLRSVIGWILDIANIDLYASKRAMIQNYNLKYDPWALEVLDCDPDLRDLFESRLRREMYECGILSDSEYNWIDQFIPVNRI